MYIGEFAERTGETPETLRYYDRIGLLVPERKGGNRWYREQDLEKLDDIRAAKNLDFTLNTIKAILQLDQRLEEGLKEGMSKEEVLEEEKEAIDELKGVLDDKYEELCKREQRIRKAKNKLKEIRGKLELRENQPEEN